MFEQGGEEYEGGREGEKERKKGKRLRGDRRTASWLRFPFAQSPHSLFSFLFCFIQFSKGGSQRDTESFRVHFDERGKNQDHFFYFL